MTGFLQPEGEIILKDWIFKMVADLFVSSRRPVPTCIILSKSHYDDTPWGRCYRALFVVNWVTSLTITITCVLYSKF